MAAIFRGADALVAALQNAGTRWLFTLSGNQIMSVFDASLDTPLELIHVRHEAAAVHMADAWGRLTGEPGVALVTAGPGFANCLSALYVAMMAESPLILLSGSAPRGGVGRGAFQDLPQAAMAAPVAKASWTVADPRQIAAEVSRAYRLATTGRPGPVHLCLPVDILEGSCPRDEAASVGEGDLPAAAEFTEQDCEAVLATIRNAERPLVLAGPALMRGELLPTLETALGPPVIGMESPRGVNDPALGAFAEVLPQADLVVLLGKKLDFTLCLRGQPAYSRRCRFVQIDADPSVLDLSRRVLDDPSRVVHSICADPAEAAASLSRFVSLAHGVRGWYDDVCLAIAYRPIDWDEQRSPTGAALHPLEVCRAVDEFLGDDPSAVFVCDGGEFGQWAQARVTAGRRIINGASGSIGGVIPFALAARLACPDSRIVATCGDGTFGFHALEFETALRHNLPIVTVIGNDALWNAERQIQLRKFGRERLVGCELSATRYDRVVSALGGHGEQVTRASDLLPALHRAAASNLPACVNVPIEPAAAPIVRRWE